MIPREYLFTLLRVGQQKAQQLFLSARNEDSANWKSASVESDLQNPFHLEHESDGYTGSIAFIQCKNASNRRRVYLLCQAIYNSNKTTIRTHFVVEKQNSNQSSNYILSRSLPEISIAGTIDVGEIHLTYCSNEHLYLLYSQGEIINLYFAPDNLDAVRWFAVFLPLHFRSGVILQPNALLISSHVHNCNGTAERKFVDLNHCEENKGKLYGPFTIEMKKSMLSQGPSQQKQIEIAEAPERLTTKHDFIVHVTSQDGRFLYTWEDNGVTLTDMALFNGYTYEFVHPHWISIHGYTKAGEKIEIEGKHPKASSEETLRHTVVHLCSESSRLILPPAIELSANFAYKPFITLVPHLSTYRYLVIQKDATAAHISFINRSLDSEHETVCDPSMHQFGLAGPVVDTYAIKKEVFIHTRVTNKSTHSAMHRVWQYNTENSEISLLTELTVAKNCDVVFMEIHDKNIFNTNPVLPVCLSAFSEDYSYFTCSCAGRNMSTNRLSDVYASEKVYFQNHWDDYYNRNFQSSSDTDSPKLTALTSLCT